MVIFTNDMSTGSVLTHGVSGYPCLGVAGDFNEQERGEPWQVIVNDPIRSYMNAQNHIGIPMSNFNEPWTGGVLQNSNFDAAPYRVPVFSEPFVGPPAPAPKTVKLAPADYPFMVGEAFAQQLPQSTIHFDVPMPVLRRQNNNFEAGTANGDNKRFIPNIPTAPSPNARFFQGGTTPTGVHPNNDKAGQQTAPNTTRPDFRGGQTPFQKLPNGTSIGTLQPNEPPQLWELAPPPDPQVRPQEGTGPLLPTVPGWW